MNNPPSSTFSLNTECTTVRHDIKALWQTYPPHENNGYLPNIHKQAITDLSFSPSDPSLLYTTSADGTLLLTSLTSGQKLGKFSAHYGPVNSLSVTNSTASGKDLCLTGGDDGVARVWDPVALVEDGEKTPVAELDDGLGGCVTAVEWGKDGGVCYVGGIDNEIKVSPRETRSRMKVQIEGEGIVWS